MAKAAFIAAADALQKASLKNPQQV